MSNNKSHVDNKDKIYQQRFKKIALLIVVGLVTVCLLLVILMKIELGILPSTKIQKAKAALKAIPGIEVINIDFDDGGHGYVVVNVKDKGKITFAGFTPEQLSNSSHLYLEKIGSCNFNTYDYSSDTEVYNPTGQVVKKTSSPSFGFGSAIDIGYDGPFTKIIGVQIKTVAEAISNYDNILAIVRQWPDSNIKLSPKLSLADFEGISFVTDGNGRQYYSAHCEKR